MARTRSNPVTTTTVTMDAVDNLVAKLNEIENLSFVRDAWENKAPDNYGVVEENGQSSALWADNAMVEQVFQLTVHVYESSGDNAMISAVQTKLAVACDSYSMPTHEYLFDISKNHWQWTVWIVGPLQWTEEVTVGG